MWYNLGSQLVFTISNFFINTFDIPNEVILLLNKTFSIDYILWHGYYYYIEIKNFIFAAYSLFKYLKDYCLYGFNRQKIFEAKYIAKNLQGSQKYKKHNNNNIEYKNNILAIKT